MRIVTLMENTRKDESLCCAHGLSVYLETPRHRILMDMGPDEQFLENAEKLGVDLSAVDIAVLSHGHYDHAGGLDAFCRINDHAPIYVHELAFGPYFGTSPQGTERYIGMSEEAKSHTDRFIINKDSLRIDDELLLFSALESADLLSSSNAFLHQQLPDGQMVPDAFEHEQYLLVRAEGKCVLLSGCSHRGIVNIARTAASLAEGPLDYVFGGFHLSNPALGGSEPRELVDAVAEQLMLSPTRYFTGHCTGPVAYGYLQETMGEALGAMTSGFVYDLV